MIGRGGGLDFYEFCLLKRKKRVVDIGVLLPHKMSFQTFWFISRMHAMVLILDFWEPEGWVFLTFVCKCNSNPSIHILKHQA